MSELQCPLCYEWLDGPSPPPPSERRNLVVFACRHYMCDSCCLQYFGVHARRKIVCPTCKADLADPASRIEIDPLMKKALVAAPLGVVAAAGLLADTDPLAPVVNDCPSAQQAGSRTRLLTSADLPIPRWAGHADAPPLRTLARVSSAATDALQLDVVKLTSHPRFSEVVTAARERFARPGVLGPAAVMGSSLDPHAAALIMAAVARVLLPADAPHPLAAELSVSTAAFFAVPAVPLCGLSHAEVSSWLFLRSALSHAALARYSLHLRASASVSASTDAEEAVSASAGAWRPLYARESLPELRATAGGTALLLLDLQRRRTSTGALGAPAAAAAAAPAAGDVQRTRPHAAARPLPQPQPLPQPPQPCAPLSEAPFIAAAYVRSGALLPPAVCDTAVAVGDAAAAGAVAVASALADAPLEFPGDAAALDAAVRMLHDHCARSSRQSPRHPPVVCVPITAGPDRAWTWLRAALLLGAFPAHAQTLRALHTGATQPGPELDLVAARYALCLPAYLGNVVELDVSAAVAGAPASSEPRTHIAKLAWLTLPRRPVVAGGGEASEGCGELVYTAANDEPVSLALKRLQPLARAFDNFASRNSLLLCFACPRPGGRAVGSGPLVDQVIGLTFYSPDVARVWATVLCAITNTPDAMCPPTVRAALHAHSSARAAGLATQAAARPGRLAAPLSCDTIWDTRRAAVHGPLPNLVRAAGPLLRIAPLLATECSALRQHAARERARAVEAAKLTAHAAQACRARVRRIAALRHAADAVLLGVFAAGKRAVRLACATPLLLEPQPVATVATARGGGGGRGRGAAPAWTPVALGLSSAQACFSEAAVRALRSTKADELLLQRDPAMHAHRRPRGAGLGAGAGDGAGTGASAGAKEVEEATIELGAGAVGAGGTAGGALGTGGGVPLRAYDATDSTQLHGLVAVVKNDPASLLTRLLWSPPEAAAASTLVARVSAFVRGDGDNGSRGARLAGAAAAYDPLAEADALFNCESPPTATEEWVSASPGVSRDRLASVTPPPASSLGNTIVARACLGVSLRLGQAVKLAAPTDGKRPPAWVAQLAAALPRGLECLLAAAATQVQSALAPLVGAVRAAYDGAGTFHQLRLEREKTAAAFAELDSLRRAHAAVNDRLNASQAQIALLRRNTPGAARADTLRAIEHAAAAVMPPQRPRPPAAAPATAAAAVPPVRAATPFAVKAAPADIEDGDDNDEALAAAATAAAAADSFSARLPPRLPPRLLSMRHPDPGASLTETAHRYLASQQSRPMRAPVARAATLSAPQHAVVLAPPRQPQQPPQPQPRLLPQSLSLSQYRPAPAPAAPAPAPDPASVARRAVPSSSASAGATAAAAGRVRSIGLAPAYGAPPTATAPVREPIMLSPFDLLQPRVFIASRLLPRRSPSFVNHGADDAIELD